MKTVSRSKPAGTSPTSRKDRSNGVGDLDGNRRLAENLQAIEDRDPKENAFPDVADEMFDSIIGMVQWHIGQVQMQLDARNVPWVNRLSEIRNELTEALALAWLLHEVADTAQ